jgi:selenium metabolism protein YedF
MKFELDCRGLNCPAPVLKVRDAIEQEQPTSISVIVDNDAARQNVSRFLEHRHYQVSFYHQGADFIVSASNSCAVPEVEVDAVGVSPNAALPGTKKIMVLVTSSNMGHGDDGLGDMLMFNFIKTLKEMGPELWRVVFVNSGVSFVSEGSEAVSVLQVLVSLGVEVTACGACLAYFHLLDKLQVGEVTNMLEIVTAMKQADSVVTI